MDLGNYVYIIVIVGVVIFNILKLLRKQEESTPIPDLSENHPYSTTGEEVDFWGNPIPVSPKEQITHQPVIQPMQSRSKVEPVAKNKSKEKPLNLLNEKQEEHPVSVAFNNTDDARRAFISSEIWNRKY